MLSFFALFIACVVAQFGCDNFNYGQADWGSVACPTSTNICTADTSTAQSPINVLSRRETSPDQLSELRFTGYEDGLYAYKADGNNIRITYSSRTAQMRNLNSGKGVFKAKLIVAHMPAEHMLPGLVGTEVPDLEVQFYHQGADGSWAVVSTFYKADDTITDSWLSFLDPALVSNGQGQIIGFQNFWDSAQDAKEDSYLYYTGSLTQPPCTEGVLWHLYDNIFPVPSALLARMQATLSRTVANGGDARPTQRDVASVLYWDAKASAFSDPLCGGDLPTWVKHPYACTDQYDKGKCFYCAGRANLQETKGMCLNRMGRGCNELFNTPEALSFCNVAFECPASGLSASLLMVCGLLFVALMKLW